MRSVYHLAAINAGSSTDLILVLYRIRQTPSHLCGASPPSQGSGVSVLIVWKIQIKAAFDELMIIVGPFQLRTFYNFIFLQQQLTGVGAQDGAVTFPAQKRAINKTLGQLQGT